MTTVDDGKLSVICTLVAQVPEAWEGLDQVQRHRFDSYMASGNIHTVAHLIQMSLGRPALREAAARRIQGMNSGDLGQVVAVGVREEAVDRAVSLFIRAGSWHSANQISAMLIMPLIDQITPDHVRAIIKSPTEHKSDLRYSGGVKIFIESIRERQILPEDELGRLLQEHGFEYLMPNEKEQAKSQ